MTMEILRIAAIFAGLQTVNVVFQTVRTLLLARTNNIHTNAIMSAVAFGFYVVVVNQIANTPIEITIPLTLVTNMLGVYISFHIFKKWQKEDLWKIEVYAPENGDREELEKLEGISKKVDGHFTTFYCYTRQESDAAKATIQKLENAKHNITKLSKF